jgi:photosystem II stability/assembly factor-like uncharacterized protein
MRVGRWTAGLGCSIALIAGLAWGAATSGSSKLVDVLDAAVTPAPAGSAAAVRATRGVVTGIARPPAGGSRVVAVGPRGLILVSTDLGASWHQAPSPVSADLVSARFTSDSVVWAVGHDGVILRSTNAGDQWERVLDGRALEKLLKDAYPASTSEALAREVEQGAGQSATPGVWPAPFLDIAFVDERRGFAVGAFGLIVRTDDGGKTWRPWIEHVANDKRYHLYAIASHAGQTYVAGEQGLLLRLDASGDRFEQMPSPYNGTFFGIDLFEGKRIVAHGLRGNAYLSKDAGATWQKLETGTLANIVSAAQSPERVTLVSQNGEVLAFAVAGGPVQKLHTPGGPEVFGAVPTASNRMAVARLSGPTVLEWSANP